MFFGETFYQHVFNILLWIFHVSFTTASSQGKKSHRCFRFSYTTTYTTRYVSYVFSKMDNSKVVPRIVALVAWVECDKLSRYRIVIPKAVLVNFSVNGYLDSTLCEINQRIIHSTLRCWLWKGRRGDLWIFWNVLNCFFCLFLRERER